MGEDGSGTSEKGEEMRSEVSFREVVTSTIAAGLVIAITVVFVGALLKVATMVAARMPLWAAYMALGLGALLLGYLVWEK